MSCGAISRRQLSSNCQNPRRAAVRERGLDGREKKRRLHSRLTRPPVIGRFPLHVTMRIRHGVKTLRDTKRFDRIKRAFRFGCDRFGMRMCHFSIQDDHIHLIIEAADKHALSRGMQGLNIRVARAANRVLGRIGKFFADRYHARPLRTPTEVRNAVHYVLYNMQKHRKERGLYTHPWALDPFSSVSGEACWFNEEAMTIAAPRTWLLRNIPEVIRCGFL